MPRALYWPALLALVLAGFASPAFAQHAGRFVEAGGQSTPIYSDAVPAGGLRFGYASQNGFGIEAGLEYVRNRSIFDSDDVLGHARAVLAVRYAFAVSQRLGLDLGFGLRRGLDLDRTLCGYQDPYMGSICGDSADYVAGGPEAGAALALSPRTSLRVGGGLLSSGNVQVVGGTWAEVGFRIWL